MLQDRVLKSRREKRARNAAFTRMYREHAADVYNLALRMVGSRDDACDITQEVLLKAYQRADGPRELERAWFYKVTVNACYDHLRRVKVRPQAADDPPELASTTDHYRQAELVHEVDQTLRQMPPTQRAALLLREVHGLETREVAEALGVQPDSAAVTLTRARTSFRRHFAAVAGIAGETGAVAGRRKTVFGGSSAAAFGVLLPHLKLPRAPLPSSLDVSNLLATWSGGAGVRLAAASSEPAVGAVSRIAELFCNKAAAIGAGVTLATGTIGGTVAVEKAIHHATPDGKRPVATQTQNAGGEGSGAAVASRPKPSARPSHTSKASASPSPSASASSPAASPSASAVAEAPTPTPSASSTQVAEEPTPSPSPSATTIGESPESPSPSPSPDESTQP